MIKIKKYICNQYSYCVIGVIVWFGMVPFGFTCSYLVACLKEYLS
jgi:hypothetical protein